MVKELLAGSKVQIWDESMQMTNREGGGGV